MTLIVLVGGMPRPQTGATQDHAHLGLSIKGLVVCNIYLHLEPLDFLNGLALGCYQPSPEVLIVLSLCYILEKQIGPSVVIFELQY